MKPVNFTADADGYLWEGESILGITLPDNARAALLADGTQQEVGKKRPALKRSAVDRAKENHQSSDPLDMQEKADAGLNEAQADGTINGLNIAPKTDHPDEPNIIKDTLAKLSDDKAAWVTDDFVAAMHSVYINDRQGYKRYYYQLQKWGVAGDVDKAVRIFSKKENRVNKPTLPTLPTLPRPTGDLNLHQSNTKPTLKAINPGSLVVYDDHGKPLLMVESAGAVILAECLRGVVAYSSLAKTWHIFMGTH